MSTVPETPSIPSRLNVTDEFGYWFSGIFDGEGCFLFKNTARTVVTPAPVIKRTLREDDRSVIEYIKENLGCGRIFDGQYKSEKYTRYRPWVELKVQPIADLAEVIVPLFDRYPLQAKKAHEFRMWRMLVHWRYCRRGLRISAEEKEIYDRVYAWVGDHRGKTPTRL